MKTGFFLIVIAAIVTLSSCASQNHDKPVAGKPWTNSLGVKFVPAGTDGVLFSVWDVRKKDYAVFVKAIGHDPSSSHLFAHGSIDTPESAMSEDAKFENDPAVIVSWNDAHAFCDWLAKKEQTEGWLNPNQKYRLPTDAEWSKAVGLNEKTEGSPKDKDDKISGIYPWGTQWPPPKGAGNYRGEETKSSKYGVFPGWTFITAYNDGYADLSPVGSFPPNLYGLYDMGGNVWQWCENGYFPHSNTYRPGSDDRVLRGGSWYEDNSHSLLSSARGHNDFDTRDTEIGFRVVVVVSP